MEGFAVHKLNDNLVVSLHRLPGFRKMGTCVVRGRHGEHAGLVPMYYAGSFFDTLVDRGEFESVRSAALKLSQNYAIRTKMGVATTRFNAATAIRSIIKTVHGGRENASVQDHAQA